ncbi:long-chain fatty acid--CoA ligase [Mangrovimicrobium sediminis]|uniref:Long-chain fatty acid--CoA ligase n=1 Tax=Mangrovimicrobium sediminis TaxID=2562682 RepID=A0A4Z0M9R0_9GAMM|nr:class I adenylate-forming enzyme family protein [Haliea sp. SAOS-164]TGD76136.1 long-chain fatty acid--CoA ligase [Haliea sp. SAOS-164]
MSDEHMPATLPALFAAQVKHRGARDAVVTLSESVSYAELDRRSAELARALLELGAGKGARIALLSSDGIFWMTAFLASMRIGALVSLVSTLVTPHELRHILRNSDTQILIAERRFLRHDYVVTLEEALPALADAEAGRLRLADAPHLRSIWLDDAEGVPWAASVDELRALAQRPGAPDAALLQAVENEVTPGDEAVIVYTSGSTSAPKAVVHTQWTLARHPREVARYFLLQPDDRMMPLLPVFWLGGLVMALETLSVGATLVYPQTPEQEVVLETIERCAVNRLNSWGDMLFKLRAAAKERGIDVDSIVGLGEFRDENGELIPPQLCTNPLGMSETFAVHSAEPLNVRLPEDKAGAAGRTVHGYERRVVDPETGEEVAAGEVGELQLRGGGLMHGFYKVDRRKVFTPDGFYPTGDLVRVDADGYLFFVARRGDMIKTRAANVSRLEVEEALRALPEVELPVVTGLPDVELGERVVAAVVPAAGCTPNAAELQQALRKRLSSYKVPRDIVFITEAEIPRTSTGKLKLNEIGAMIAGKLDKA